MNELEILEKLKGIFKVIIQKDADEEKITLDSSILTDLGVNSVGLIYFVIAIEETFGIDMSDVTFNTFKTINDVVVYIKKKLEEKNA